MQFAFAVGLKLDFILLLRDAAAVIVMDDPWTHVYWMKMLFTHGLLSH